MKFILATPILLPVNGDRSLWGYPREENWFENCGKKFLAIRNNVQVHCKISEKETGEEADSNLESNTYPRKGASTLMETGK